MDAQIPILFKNLICICLTCLYMSALNASENTSQNGVYKSQNVINFDPGGRKHRIVTEKGGEFPKKSREYVRYGQDSFLVSIPKKLNGIKANSYIKNRSEIFIIR